MFVVPGNKLIHRQLDDKSVNFVVSATDHYRLKFVLRASCAFHVSVCRKATPNNVDCFEAT